MQLSIHTEIFSVDLLDPLPQPHVDVLRLYQKCIKTLRPLNTEWDKVWLLIPCENSI